MALYTVIRTDGSEENVKTSAQGGALLREVLRAIVADTADTVNLRDGRVMVVDDTGMPTPRTQGGSDLFVSMTAGSIPRSASSRKCRPG